MLRWAIKTNITKKSLRKKQYINTNNAICVKYLWHSFGFFKR